MRHCVLDRNAITVREASLAKSTVTRIFGYAVSLLFVGTSILAVAQVNTTLRESPVIEPIITEESLPEDSGECNLRTTAAYHADVFEPATALPRTQVFCGFSRRWGGEIGLPLARVDGRYGPANVAVAVKYKLREQTSRIPALVLGIETTFPTGRGESGVEAEPFVAVFKQVHGLSIQGNVGLGIRHGGREREYRAAYNGAVAVPRHVGVLDLRAVIEGLGAHAHEELERAVDLFATGPRPIARAYALEDLGVARARAGAVDAAIEALDGALVLYTEAGATWDAGRVRSRLRDHGIRRRLVARERAENGWAAMTDSELAVARLVAQGLTNREVAEQLFVSPHTVSSHLRSVFAKLEITSRLALTRIAAEHDTTATP